MKKILFIISVLFAMNGFSQNILQQNFSNNNLTNRQAVQMQSPQVFASNKIVNDNNKPVRASANPQINFVQRTTNNVSTQRRRRGVTPQVNNISNPSQVNVINVLLNNMNENVQVQGNIINQMDNNVGNAFGGSMIEQLAGVNIPAIQLGSGSLNLNLDLNLPTIKLPSIKFSSHKSVSSSNHRSFHFKNKLAKLNRKMSGKLSFGKKLKIKVDNCFKW
ncbi:MAG TPA: hypothetical protein VN026_05170 [Bacteroidia bacterium]|jgi:hypothetical protein|nr:hypothetical protein [Bacteroidia bacterium]